MNKVINILLAFSVLMANHVLADGTVLEYQTDSHHLKIDTVFLKDKRHLSQKHYIYRVWNKPNNPYDAPNLPPVMTITQGTYTNLSHTCQGKQKDRFLFRKNDRAIAVIVGDQTCFYRAPIDAKGELIVWSKGREKARFWLYEED